MSLRQRRDKFVLFRLTEQEHGILEDLCAARGGRSLSEFVRAELLNPARAVDIAPLRELVGSIEQRLSKLEQRIQSLLAIQPVEGSRV